MDEFLRQNYFILTHSVEFLAAVTGLFCLKKYKSTAAKYFIYFLLYVFIVDLLGRYPAYFENLGIFHLIENTVFERNFWWYNIFARLGFTIILSFIFYNILNSKVYKNIVYYSTVIFFIISTLYFVFKFSLIFNTSSKFLTFTSLTLIFSFLTFYFLEILQDDKILTFYKSLYFYISSTILIWWLITSPVVFYSNYFSTADWNFIFLKWQIFLFANLFMYLTFTFALIYCEPEND